MDDEERAAASSVEWRIEDAVEQGALLPGMRLPAERSLAKALSVSRTTVVSAYDRLREAGLLRSKRERTFCSRKACDA